MKIRSIHNYKRSSKVRFVAPTTLMEKINLRSHFSKGIGEVTFIRAVLPYRERIRIDWEFILERNAQTPK
jgi:hypothetical protein